MSHKRDDFLFKDCAFQTVKFTLGRTAVEFAEESIGILIRFPKFTELLCMLILRSVEIFTTSIGRL